MSGFMNSHKHWMTIDEEEPAVVNVDEPAAPSTGNDGNDDDQEGGGPQHDEGDHDDGEDVEHVVDDIIQVDNNVDADTRQTPLTDTPMSTNASILVDSVRPPSAEVCRTAASFP